MIYVHKRKMVKMLKDAPQFGLKKGETLEVVQHEARDDGYKIIRRMNGALPPKCGVLKSSVKQIYGGRWEE